MDIPPHAKSLKRNCETRFIERFYSISDFWELFDVIIASLEEIEEWDDKDAATSANLMKHAILQRNTLMSLIVIRQVFAIVLPLSKYLQRNDIDLKAALTMAEATKQKLESLRYTADNEFSQLFEECKKMCIEYEIEMKLPRRTTRADVTNIETHYRVSIYIPFLDNFINQLEDRFCANAVIFKGFQSLLANPYEEFTKKSEAELMELFNIYSNTLTVSPSDALNEFQLYRTCQTTVSLTAIEALNKTSRISFLTFSCFLKFSQLCQCQLQHQKDRSRP